MSVCEPLTRAAALSAWQDFLPKVPAYGACRNEVREGHGNVSRLGPAIRFRLLLEDEVVAETLRHHSFRAAEKWLQEVCWRRYWKGWLETRPEVWTQWRRRVGSLRQELPAQTLARAEAVAAGASGVACMDAMARELVSTGYLHNHARMWWASFWIHVERLPWELGADFFFRHLLDADAASNTLSWRWVAGLQTPGKTYLVRLSNLRKYAPHYLEGNEAGSDRLADGAVSAAQVTEAGGVARRPLPDLPTSLPKRAGRIGLWLHPDDLAPEVGPLAGLAPASVAACLGGPTDPDVSPLSARRLESLRTVLGDGLARASAHFACPAMELKAADPAQGLGEWAESQSLDEVVALAPMVGPTQDVLPRIHAALSARGIRLTLVRRPSDEFAFSLATAGFFPFWEKMGRHLSQFPSA